MFKWLQNIFSTKPAPVNPVKKSAPFDLGEVKASDLNLVWDITYEDRNGEITERPHRGADAVVGHNHGHNPNIVNLYLLKA